MTTPDSFRDDDAFGPPDDPTWEPQPICWPRVDRDTALNTWYGLDTWIRWTVHRYGLDHRTVPPCWYRHGALVEELTALHTAWLAARARLAPGNAPLDWHAMFAVARQRLQDWVARAGCRPDEHRAQDAACWINVSDHRFDTHVLNDIDRRESSPTTGHSAE
jgi:hypothetical protein